MKLIAYRSDVTSSEPIVGLNADDCLQMGVDYNDRVRITSRQGITAAVAIFERLVPKGRIAFPPYLMGKCGAEDGEEVEVVYSPMPESIRSIRRKIDGARLGKEEIDAIVEDILEGNLSDREIISFVSAFNVNNSDIGEVACLTRAMADTGRKVDLGHGPVFDFHSLGGIPGNKVTPIVVSILAAEGIRIPKLSSRAISSACGTSDFVDVFCDVEMDSERLVRAVDECGGVFACGNEDYAPVGKTIIKAERPLGIDPRPTMMASIMSKKVALGITHLLTDIPLGNGTKTPDIGKAREYAAAMRELGQMLGIHVGCAITRADEPLGRCIGPVLEARECISVLEGRQCDPSVADKACSLAGIVLEMAGRKDGRRQAEEVLRSGRAHAKFLQIVKTQNGDPDLRSEDLVPGAFTKDVHAKRDGYVGHIDNPSIVAIAKAAGAPLDTGAGIELLHKTGDRVAEGEALFRIYAENGPKLERAVESARSRRPMVVTEDPPAETASETVIEKFP